MKLAIPGRAVVPLAIAVLVAAWPVEGHAMQAQPELIDRIVAVVGDTIILQSELEEQIFRLRAQGVQVPSEPNRFNQFLDRVLEQKINEMLIVINARREGMSVTRSEVNDAVDQRLAQIKRQFQTEAEFQNALQSAGITPPEFRIQLSEQVEAEMLAQRFLQSQMQTVQPTPVSEEEIRERFEQQRQALGPKPATVSLKQVVIRIDPSQEALTRARELASEARSRALAGEDFARLARAYSDDQATRPEGGELGWLSRGQLLPAFEEELFSLGAGDISDVVRTPVGYHVIKVDRVRGTERFARHILVSPELTSADSARARERASQVAEALKAGADPDSLIQAYGDPDEQGTLTNFPKDELPSSYQGPLESVETSDVVGPFRASTGAGRSKWVVAKVTAVNQGGSWTLEDVRESLRRQIEQEKMLDQFVDRLRESTYIEIRS